MPPLWIRVEIYRQNDVRHLSELPEESAECEEMTDADDLKDSAKIDIKSAISSLNKIVVDGCWGSNDFTDEYRKKLSDALGDLIRIYATL